MTSTPLGYKNYKEFQVRKTFIKLLTRNQKVYIEKIYNVFFRLYILEHCKLIKKLYHIETKVWSLSN